MIKRALLIDVDYGTYKGQGMIRLTVKSGKFHRIYDPTFLPYFYIGSDKSIDKGLYGSVEIVNVETVKRLVSGKEKMLTKVTCRNPQDVPILSEILGRYGPIYENRINFGRRYLIDKGLRPMNIVEIDVDDADKHLVRNIKDAGEAEEGGDRLNTMAFDIEVHAPFIAPREKHDPVIIISYDDGSGPKAITWKSNSVKDVETVKDEKGLIERFCQIVKEKDVEILVGYNSGLFDIPYLMNRAKLIGTRLALGRGGQEPGVRRIGMTSRVDIEGRIHFDAFYSIRLLAAAQAIKLQRYTLEEVYNEMIGEKQWKFDIGTEMPKLWETEEGRNRYLEYGKNDALATIEIFDRIIALQTELARLTQLPLADISGATTGQLVEALLMNEAYKRNITIPSRPGEDEARIRSEAPIEGAYVKLPNPGIYDKIAVLDFRSLYPSIIISRNVDPETINCGHNECKENNSSPVGHYFCTKNIGLIPNTIRDLLERRKHMKRALKSAKGKEGIILNARVAALKIVLNTFYGMLGYARARWYTREGAEAVTAWGRYYVQDVAKKAEESGFSVLYADTDSIFILMRDKTENDVRSFMDSINKDLPEMMELELEDFYNRGVFVSKKQEKKSRGAKKKYALINREGKIKIKGFELVRRDWSKIAKETQKRVLETILKEGSKEKAMEIVKETVKRLKEGNVSKEDLTIYTQIRKKNYEILSPEISAVEKARKRGMKIDTGAIIGYIITKRGRNISERAELTEYAEDYDPDYYINNQVIPATLRILGELGYSDEDIKFEGKQSSLDTWM
jgi:DNA polymerase I